MKGKNFWITAVALAAIAVVSVLAYRSARRPPAGVCQICQRSLHSGVTYHLETAKETEQACCPRCGMHFVLEHPGTVRRAWATDLNTGETVAAQSASYVEGGDVEYCTMGEKPVERRPEGISFRAYDRCLPTLVAFKTLAEADSYRTLHGGRVLDYEQAIDSVKQR